MADTYSVKFSHGTSSFEVQGPSDTWVDARVSELKELMEALPAPKVLNETPNDVTPTTKKAPKKTAPKTTSTQKSADAKSQLDEKWSDELATSILTYVDERQGGFDKGTTKQAAILGIYLKDIESISAINPQDLEFIYRKLGWPTISHANQLDNARKRDRFFEKTTNGYELTHAGTVFGRDTSKTITKTKKI